MIENLIAIMGDFLNDPIKACSMLLLCMVFDFITGIYGAYKHGEPITSRKMREGLVDKFKWILGASFGYCVQFIIGYNGIVLAVIGFGLTTELLSIGENFKKIGIIGGKHE